MRVPIPVALVLFHCLNCLRFGLTELRSVFTCNWDMVYACAVSSDECTSIQVTGKGTNRTCCKLNVQLRAPNAQHGQTQGPRCLGGVPFLHLNVTPCVAY